MSCDPCGSHVIDTFFMADIVGEKNKDTFLKKLQVTMCLTFIALSKVTSKVQNKLQELFPTSFGLQKRKI